MAAVRVRGDLRTWERIGKEYASVFPEPCLASACRQSLRRGVLTHSLCHADDVLAAQAGRKSPRLDLGRLDEVKSVQSSLQR